MPHYTDWVTNFKANISLQHQADSANNAVGKPESLIVPIESDDIIRQPDADDSIIGLELGPVNKLADQGWWTVDGADFRDIQKDSLNEGGHSLDIWTHRGESTFTEIYVDFKDPAIGSEHWPEPAAELFLLGSADESLGSRSDPMLRHLGSESVLIHSDNQPFFS